MSQDDAFTQEQPGIRKSRYVPERDRERMRVYMREYRAKKKLTSAPSED